MPFTPEISDIWINTSRGAIQFKDATNPHSKTITPSANWFTAGESLVKGDVVSIVNENWNLESGNTLGRAYKTDTRYVTKSLGLVLRPAGTGEAVEVQKLGRFYFDSAVFDSADIGKKVYAHPTDGTLTTDRNLAASNSNIIEIGTIVATDQLDLHIESDLRDSVDITIFEYQLDAQIVLPVTVDGEYAYIDPKLFAINPSTGKLIYANRATPDVRFYETAGILIGTNAANDYTGGNWTIAADTRVLVQRGGLLTKTRIKDLSGANKAIYLKIDTSALNPGDKLYLDDIDGLYTNSEPSVVYSGDTFTEIGHVKSAHTSEGKIILTIRGPYRYRPDTPFPIGAIVHQPGANPDYGWFTCDGSGYDTTTYAELFATIGYTFGGSGSTFNIPNLNNGTDYQIRYSSYYVGNPSNGLNPVHRYRTGWAAYTGFSDTVTLDLTALFSSPWDARDIIMVLSMREVVDPDNIINIYPGIINQTYYESTVFQRQTYGYEVKSDPANANNLILNIGKNGIAYYNEAGDAIGGDPEDPTFHPYIVFPTDSSWEFAWTVYKAEQWNRFIDPEQDLRLQSLWQLDLIDLKSPGNLNPENNQEDGHLDRTTTDPVETHTTRLNYDGDFYTSGLHISQGVLTLNKTKSTATPYLKILGQDTDDELNLTYNSPNNSLIIGLLDNGAIPGTSSLIMNILPGGSGSFIQRPSIDDGTLIYRGGIDADSPFLQLTGRNLSNGAIILQAGQTGDTTGGNIDIQTQYGGVLTLQAGATGNLLLNAGSSGTGSISLKTSNLPRIGIDENGNTSFSFGTLTCNCSGVLSSTLSSTAAINCYSVLTLEGGSGTGSSRSKIQMSSKTLYLLGADSVEGSDDGRAHLCGGAVDSNTRGGFVSAYGNEHGSNAGQLLLQSGDTGSIYILPGNGDIIYESPSNILKLLPNTLDDSDDQILQICSGGTASTARGAYIVLGGNESTENGGLHLRAGNGVTKGDITFFCAGSEFMKIDSDTGGTPSRSFLILTGTPVSGYEVVVNGDVQATSFNATSSLALKKNIRPFLQSALAIVANTKIVSYQFKTDNTNKNKRIGIIAEHTDELIAGKNHNSFDYSNTLALVLRSIQELSAEIKELKIPFIKKIQNKLRSYFKWHSMK